MSRGLQGQYRVNSAHGEKVKSFIPADLPPEPPIEWSSELMSLFEEANRVLGKLDGVAETLPNISIFLYSYVRKEAVLSSMIEGTQSSISDLLLFESDEAPGVPIDDAREVSNYVAALHYGVRRLEEGFPLSLRLIREMHEVLLNQGRGRHQSPGEFRTTQNWIGGTRPGNAVFVPPPSEELMNCLGKLELFLHDQPTHTPALLKATLAHVQFETIHPFLDGNGRLGRLLITLILYDQKVLRAPILYLSLYFKTHRQYYYELLTRVRMQGDWEAWGAFFAEAIISTGKQAIQTTESLEALFLQHKSLIKTLGRPAQSALAVLQALMERPIANAKWVSEQCALSPATTNKSLKHLCELGIVRELTSQKRNRLFSYHEYLDVLNERMDGDNNI